MNKGWSSYSGPYAPDALLHTGTCGNVTYK